MEKATIERINALARKSRTPGGLTGEEKAEQKALRAEYAAAIRQSLQAQLETVTIQEPDGTRHALRPKKTNG